MTTQRILLLLLLLLSSAISFVRAQDENQYNYAKFSPKMAIIIVVLVAALFSMGFISIYIRHCSDTSGSVRRTLSMRGRRAAAARGLDASVIESFPTFTYSEVKGHKIGKGALECAVCLNEFEDEETLRLIPKCDHVFHPECIDAWLDSHVTCPVCRTDLVPQPGDAPVQLLKPNLRSDEIAIHVDQQPEVAADTNRSSEFPNQPPRSWSVRTARVFGLGKFRSHSTGHSLVQPGENLDRFTLRLPDFMRKEMMDRAVLNRAKSVAIMLPRERSSRVGRFYPSAKSDRWALFSVRSTKGVEAGESSGTSGPPPVKLPSFNCLEPKTSDEIVLISKDRS